MAQHVLVINSGSSSLKYQVVDAASGEASAVGLIERIGERTAAIKHTAATGSYVREHAVADHQQAVATMLELFDDHGPALDEMNLVAVGHRVVQGGARYHHAALITESVIDDIEDLASLAPLHNPAHLQGIISAREVFSELPHVAVFDTAFHQSIPDHIATYALDRQIANQYRIRRYGAHGTSHEYVAKTAADHLGIPRHEFNAIIAHLGNGASMTAIRNGASYDTSMGLTPLEGLVMGSRTGDIDPAAVFHLGRNAGMSLDEIDTLFNKRSGMLGLTGLRDMRDIEAAAAQGDAAASEALEIYTYRLRKYVGSYVAALGRVDAVIFTAGIGENSETVRAGTLRGLDNLGIVLDSELNELRAPGIRDITDPTSQVKVLVVPTNEEWEIARQSVALVES